MRLSRVIAAGSLLLVCGCEVGSVSSSAGPAPGRPLPDDPSAVESRPASPSVDPAADPSLRCARPPELPGSRLYSAADVGTGDCAATSVGQAIAAVHEGYPELRDIEQIYDPRGGISDGSYVYAFLRPDGGYALVFKRGGGDCPSGCTENDYWYFETSVDCTLTAAGQSHLQGGCYPADQLPRWGVPESVSPSRVCGANNEARQLPASTSLQACGARLACDPKASGTPLSTIFLFVTQDPTTLAAATVTLSGTGDRDLDGVSWPATVDRARVTVSVHTNNLPAQCLEGVDFDLDYDFEGFGLQRLDFAVTHTYDCSGDPNAYCKGGVTADLAPQLD